MFIFVCRSLENKFLQGLTLADLGGFQRFPLKSLTSETPFAATVYILISHEHAQLTYYRFHAFVARERALALACYKYICGHLAPIYPAIIDLQGISISQLFTYM